MPKANLAKAQRSIFIYRWNGEELDCRLAIADFRFTIYDLQFTIYNFDHRART